MWKILDYYILSSADKNILAINRSELEHVLKINEEQKCNQKFGIFLQIFKKNIL